MALVACKDCKKEFSSTAKQCPNCGARRSSYIVTYGGGFIVCIVFIVWLCVFSSDGTGVSPIGSQQVQAIYNKVAADAVAQYEIVARNGTKIDICGQTQFVSAAYLQAKDEASYKHWKLIEKEKCMAAGIQQ